MRNWKNCCVTSDASLIEVMRVIDKSTFQTALVVNEDIHLLGIITDGDVRRGI